MSDSVRPHRRKPTRLLCSWDSPGKNTGVGCHFLLQCMKVKSESEVAQSCPTLSDTMDCSLPGSSAHGIFQARVLEWGAIAFSENSVRPSLSLPSENHVLVHQLAVKFRSLILKGWDAEESAYLNSHSWAELQTNHELQTKLETMMVSRGKATK